jgi:hypothetical protein
MNKRIRQFEKESGIELYGLGKDREKWENALSKFTLLIVNDCAEQSMSIGSYNTPSGITPDLAIAIAVGLKKHFGVNNENRQD